MSITENKPVIFLSHNSEDKPAVEEIAKKLESEHNIEVWLDKWNLVPGDPFVPALEDGLKKSDGVVVFVGPGGFGSWHNKELQYAIDRQARSKDRFPVIPVLLPGGKKSGTNDSLPNFLNLSTWVELSESSDPEAIRRIAKGVFGLEPGSSEAANLKKSNEKSSEIDLGRIQRAEQERLAIDSHDVFIDNLRQRFVKILSDPGLLEFVKFLNKGKGTESVSAAAQSLLAIEPPTESLREIIRGCKHLERSLLDQQWYTIKEIFLNLLLRLIDPNWVQKQIDREENDDVRLFHLAVSASTPSRGVEVIMARLDSDRGGILFQEHSPEPTTQIHAGDFGIYDTPEPQAEVLVENLGLHLLTKFDEEVPERMTTHHWQLLDTNLRWRSNDTHSYYFVIPKEDSGYGHPQVLIALHQYLPNLPRFQLNSASENTPLLCSPYEVDGSVKAFWDLKPK